MPLVYIHRLQLPASFRIFVSAMLAFAALASGGCAEKSRSNMPTYAKNPNPTHGYDLTVTIQDTPGPFLVVEGLMQYDITNMDCLPPAEYFSGVQTTPISTSLPIALKKINATTYQGSVALDGLIDDDYFGHGICHFKAVASSIRFQAAGTETETRFYAKLYADDMRTTESKTSYYWRDLYPESRDIKGYPDHGRDSPDVFKESLRNDLFSITISARKAQP